jgi:uncharacterized protein
MRARARVSVVLTVIVLCSWRAAVLANGLEGEWIGSLDTEESSTFVQLRLGGEHETLAGRIDFPTNGVRGVLLKHLRVDGDRLSFSVPGDPADDLLVDARLGEGRITGSARQGRARARLELVKAVSMPEPRFAPHAGHYEFDEGDALLLYHGPQGPAYVEYGTGRAGLLFGLSDEVLVSGSGVLRGYPIELTARAERGRDGRTSAVTWTRGEERMRRARRTDTYDIEEVSLPGPAVSLAATVLVPRGRGPFPGVVLIQGSGAVARAAMWPIAHVFASRGVAVLFHDKRGIGGSTGVWQRATFEDLADDALAGVAWLREHPAIDPSAIGLHGSSLGGWVAPLAAARSGDVSFVILEAPPAITPAEHERLRVEAQMTADGRPADVRARALAFMDRKFEVGRTGRGWAAVERAMEQGRQEGWLHYTNPPASLDSLRWNWTHILSHDPRPALERLRVPVLALYGALDAVVPPNVHASRLDEALRRAGNPHVTVRIFPGANHHFLAAQTGGPAEVGRLSRFVADYFESRVRWLRDDVAHVGGPAVDHGLVALAHDRVIPNSTPGPRQRQQWPEYSAPTER